MKRLVFDIETEPFTEEFRKATSLKTRTKLAPRMRVACVFDPASGEYCYYGPHQKRSLVRRLQSADEVVSFNGKQFDVLVLRRHCGLKGRLPHKGKHIDLHQVMSDKAGFRVKLDVAVSLNLGERKHTHGRKMSSLLPDELKEACRSDVSQTHQLHQRHINGKLWVPGPRRQGWRTDSDCTSSDVPRQCSSCQAVDCLEKIDWDTHEMSEGQESDYLAGFFGSGECSKCSDVMEWGF